MSWDMRLDDWKKFCDLQNTKNTQKAEPMICDDCFHNTVCRLDGNEKLEWCSARVPSADVVEVVRCKDCKYSESAPKWKDFELGCMLHREYTTATDFCSQAERKEAEE